MDKFVRDIDIDLSDPKTQIIVAGGILIGGYLLISGRNRVPDTASIDSEPRTFVVETGSAFGTRSDVQAEPGAWGWVGNSDTTVPVSSATEAKEDSFTITVGGSVVDAGSTVNVSSATGSKMNDKIDVFLNHL